MKCDVVTLDNSLQNSYDSHLLGGGELPIPYNAYITQSQIVSGQDISVHVSRAISRLKKVFVSFYKATANASATRAEDKEWLNLMHPMTASAGYNNGYDMKLQMQVGS